MVVRLKFQRSEFFHRFVTDMVSGFSTSAFFRHLFKDRKKTLVLQGFSGCIVNVCYTPRDSPTKDAVEVVVLLWGFFVCFLTSPPPKYLSSRNLPELLFSQNLCLWPADLGTVKKSSAKGTQEKHYHTALCELRDTAMHIVLPISLQKVCGIPLKFRLHVYFKNHLSLLNLCKSMLGWCFFKHMFYSQPLRSETLPPTPQHSNQRNVVACVWKLALCLQPPAS